MKVEEEYRSLKPHRPQGVRSLRAVRRRGGPGAAKRSALKRPVRPVSWARRANQPTCASEEGGLSAATSRWPPSRSHPHPERRTPWGRSSQRCAPLHCVTMPLFIALAPAAAAVLGRLTRCCWCWSSGGPVGLVPGPLPPDASVVALAVLRGHGVGGGHGRFGGEPGAGDGAEPDGSLVDDGGALAQSELLHRQHSH